MQTNEKYMDTSLSPEERAKLLLEDLDLNEKIAQLNCIFPFTPNVYNFDAMKKQAKYGIGQVSTLEMRGMETTEDVVSWQRRVQELVIKQSPHHIPAIFHMEGLCGAFFQGSTSFPSGISRGASFDPELEEKIAQVVSREEAAIGITHIFAPVLDVSRDSRMGRQGETYGEDPTLCAAMGAAYTKGIQSTETAGRHPESVAKHFLAFHNSQGGIHGTHSDTPPRLLREVYAKPFQAAISESKLCGIMPCYCTINGESVSASYEYLQKLLREDMGFNGVVVSDYGAVGNSHSVHHLEETFEEAALRCLSAGIDMELPSPAGFNENFKVLFAEGKADMDILDRAVLRVLTAKFRMGLFEHPFAAKDRELFDILDNKTGAELSLRSARESIVLLKNDGVLPLSKKIKKLAVIGPHAAFANKMFGGYTHLSMAESVLAVANSIAGVSGTVQKAPDEIVTVPSTNIQSDETPEFDVILKRQKPNCKSLLDELRARLTETEVIYAYGYPIAGSDESCFDEALKAAKAADAVIITLGGKYGTCSMSSMGEGVDASNINLPPCQDSFIRKVSTLGKPVIGVHFDGRPISSDTADKCLSAILEAWSPSEMGAPAVTDVLFGDYNPSGKLPVTVARNAGQIPIYYNHPYGSAWDQSGSIGFADYVDLPHTPRYFFGHGLSYTTFQYSDISVSQKEIAPDACTDISFIVKNIGNRSGDEIVQLYLIDEYASMTRPVKELAGFKRLTLEPEEARRVTFTIKADIMAFLDINMRWKIEKGRFLAEIGSSSEDIRLRGEYYVKENGWVEGKERSFYAKSSVE